jgi:hypothetical protein
VWSKTQVTHHSAHAIDLFGAQKQCSDHRLEIDPLQSPAVLKCRSCGAIAPLSQADIHWPSNETQGRQSLRRRRGWLKRASWAIILLALVIALIVFGKRFFAIYQAEQFRNTIDKSASENADGRPRDSRRDELRKMTSVPNGI